MVGVAVLLPNTGLPVNHAIPASENHATVSGPAWSPQHGSDDISIYKRLAPVMWVRCTAPTLGVRPDHQEAEINALKEH